MSERKINLEEIFKKQNPTDTGTIPDWVRDLCIEACRQTLELAAENAKTEKRRIDYEGVRAGGYYIVDVVDKQSIEVINEYID